MPKLRRVQFNNGVPKELPGKSNILECDLVIESDEFVNYIPRVSQLLGSFISLTTLRLKFQGASLPDAYEIEEGQPQLPNLRTFHTDMHFREFDESDKEMYNEYTWSDFGEAIYRFIIQLVAPRMEQLSVTVRHSTCWDSCTEDFLRDLFRTFGKSSTLRTLEFIQGDHRLSADSHCFESIFGCPCNSNVVLSGQNFVSSERSHFKLEVPEHGERGLGLQTLTFKNCRLSTGALEALLKLYTTSGAYPKFEGITLRQCVGISRESLRGVVGSEYVVFNDD
jgi:hypothetical protein